MKRIHLIIFFILLIIIAIQTVHIFNLQKDIESLTPSENLAAENILTNSNNTEKQNNTIESQNSNVITYVTNTTNTSTENTTSETTVKKYYPEKVSITLKEDSESSTGATIIIRDMNSENSVWDENYSIHKKHEGFWIELTPIEKAQIPTGTLSCQNNLLEQELLWKDLYGILEEGTYRIVKTRNINGENVQFQSNEFKIKKNH